MPSTGQLGVSFVSSPGSLAGVATRRERHVTITIYGRPECGQCEQTKKQLQRKGLSYNDINVDEDAEARKLVEDSAEQLRPCTILPMVVVKDSRGNVKVWHGFRYDNIKDLTKNS